MKERFLEYLKGFENYLLGVKNYSKLTVKTYYQPIKESILLSEIYEQNGVIIFDIRKFRIKISSQSLKTVNKKISSISSFVNYLKGKEIALKLQGASRVKTPQTLPKPIQTKNIFESLENGTFEEKLIVLMVYSFGLRISELQSIKLENIKEDFITVRGKGDKQRQIPSNKTISEFIQKYIEFEKPQEYLFEKKQKLLTKRQLQYKIDKVFKKIGIKVTPHQLRHSFATDLLNEGARINDISELLGHSSLKATSIYTKLNTNTKLKQYNMSHPLNK